MIRLPNTGTYSLELVTAQNGAQVVVCYSDATSTAYTGGTQTTAITSATTTTICATPAASTVRDVDEINIKNTYAGSHTITVQLDVAATNVPIITASLLTDESLNYTHGSGWQCKDVNGNTKATILGSVMTSAQLAVIITDETGSGALVFATSPTLVTPTLGAASATSIAGAVVATQAQQEAASAVDVVVTPGRQQYHPSAAKAWFSWTYSAGTPVIDQSYNVTSLTDTGVGVVVANLTVAMSTTKFPPFASSSTDQNAYTTAAKNISAGTIRVHLYDTTNAAADGAGAAGGFGDQ